MNTSKKIKDAPLEIKIFLRPTDSAFLPGGRPPVEGEVVDPAHGSELTGQRPALFDVRMDADFGSYQHTNQYYWSMDNSTEYRTRRHCVFHIHAHLVFITKYHRDVLSERAIRDLERIFSGVCKKFEAELVECDGEDNHVHLLVTYPPKVQLSKLVTTPHHEWRGFLLQAAACNAPVLCRPPQAETASPTAFTVSVDPSS